MIFELLSDTAGSNDNYSLKGDVLIHCGNFYQAGEVDPGLKRINAWFARQEFKRKFIVPGHNDDPVLADARNGTGELRGAEVLDGRLVEINGFRIFGIPFFHSRDNERYGLQTVEDAEAAAKRIPKAIDLLATHKPPFGVLDDSVPGENKGCMVLRNRLWQIRPRYHVFGHDMGSPGYDRFECVKCFNVSQDWPCPLPSRSYRLETSPQ